MLASRFAVMCITKAKVHSAQEKRVECMLEARRIVTYYVWATVLRFDTKQDQTFFAQQLHSKKAIFFLWLLCLRVGRGQKKATMMNEPEEEGEDKKALVQFSEFQEDIQSEDSTHRRRKIDYDDEVRTGQPPSGI